MTCRVLKHLEEEVRSEVSDQKCEESAQKCEESAQFPSDSYIEKDD